MIDKIEIPYNDMEFIWISNHYDIHLTGLCRYNEELHRFSTDYESCICTVYPLALIEKVRWLWRKRCFEICIGYHWSYPERADGIGFYYKWPRWLWKLVFRIYYGIKRS